jgi:mannose-6-phosphate isomerase
MACDVWNLPEKEPSIMTQFAPLRFQPIFRDYLWGGQRLAEKLGKPTGPGIWAESWEIVDHDQAQSTVVGGKWDGRTLGYLMTNHGPSLVGDVAWERITRQSIPESLRGRFPLLLKFLDAAQDLSVQVHPNDALAARVNPPDLGKTEAWYVLDAAPGSRVFAGLRKGVDRNQLADAVQSGTTADVLHSFQPQKGDCIFIPAGTVHAIGAGLLILEIQQTSNTTWRLFDWNRLDTCGNSRELHVDQSLDAIDYTSGPVNPVERSSSENQLCESLVHCDYFRMLRRNQSGSFRIGGDEQMHIVAVTSGKFEMESTIGRQSLKTGETCLIPASCAAVNFFPIGDGELIEILA